MVIYSQGRDCGSKEEEFDSVMEHFKVHNFTLKHQVCGDLNVSSYLDPKLNELGDELKVRGEENAEKYVFDSGWVQEREKFLEDQKELKNVGGNMVKCFMRNVLTRFLRKFYDNICEFSEKLKITKNSSKDEKLAKDICVGYKKSVNKVQKKLQIKKEEAQKQVILGSDELVKYYEQEFVFDRCEKSFFNVLSLSNRYMLFKPSITDDWIIPSIEVILAVALLIGLIAFEYWHEKFYAEFVDVKTAIGEFTLMIENLPCGPEYEGKFDIQQTLRQLIEDDRDNHGLPVQKKVEIQEFSYAFNPKHYLSMKEKMHQKRAEEYRIDLENRVEALESGSFQDDHSEFSETVERKARVQAEIHMLRASLAETLNGYTKLKKTDMLGVAFVTINDAEDLDHIRLRYAPRKCLGIFGCCSKKRNMWMRDPLTGKEIDLRVSQAREPGDIIWANLGIPPWQRALREFITIFLIILSCGLGLYAVYKFEYSKVKILAL